MSLLSIECWVLDQCRAFDRLACVDAHLWSGLSTIWLKFRLKITLAEFLPQVTLRNLNPRVAGSVPYM
jgi:hypothetical protein